MLLIQIWLLRLAMLVLAALCFLFGGLTARKGFQVHQHEAMGLGAFVFFMGFALLYLMTMF